MKDKLFNEECIEGMSKLPDSSIDMILCDLPYGTTANDWDSVIPFGDLWRQYCRVIRGNGAIVLFGAEPFSTKLRESNLSMWKYDWVWNKKQFSNFMNAKKQPLKIHEIISVFSKGVPPYYPQGVKLVNKVTHQGASQSDNIGGGVRATEYIQEATGYPKSILTFSRDSMKIHPTQKPVSLLSYLIKTYTQPGDLVLDNCAGGGSTIIACLNTGRHFVGYEMDKYYYEAAEKRIENYLRQRGKSSVEECYD